jgi:hypothetical protein
MTYYNNKVKLSILFALLLFWLSIFFGYHTLVYFTGLGYVHMPLIFGWHMFGAGGLPPHPDHAPPARRAVLPGVLGKHMCSCLSYITVHY